MSKEEISVPIWFLKHIEDTLRIENNINFDKKTGETCQDRNIKQALNGVRKILRGDALTGNERLEPLKPYNKPELTWEDIKTIEQILADSDWYDFEINGKLWSKEFYEEVLYRFNISKEAKK